MILLHFLKWLFSNIQANGSYILDSDNLELLGQPEMYIAGTLLAKTRYKPKWIPASCPEQFEVPIVYGKHC